MITLSAIHIYPIKSCRGINMQQAVLGSTGLEHDRQWMVVDADGRFLSQREHPRMATIVPTLHAGCLSIDAPGMPTLQLPLALRPGLSTTPVTVWDDQLQALDEGEAARHWFTRVMGSDARLVRFDPAARRACSTRWTNGVAANTYFSDGFPLLITGTATLQDLNRRMQQKGAPALPMERFRPNLVVDGLEVGEEDYLDTLSVSASLTTADEIVLQLVKPCVRCEVPGIDQHSGLRHPQWPHEPLDTMATYRADPRMDGGLTFGQNAIVTSGSGQLLAVGQALEYSFKF